MQLHNNFQRRFSHVFTVITVFTHISLTSSQFFEVQSFIVDCKQTADHHTASIGYVMVHEWNFDCQMVSKIYQKNIWLPAITQSAFYYS